MSLVTPRKGYKSVPWLFGKEIEIPQEWEMKRLDEIGEIVGGGTPDSTNKDYWDGEILWAVPTDITKLQINQIENTERKITKLGLKNSSAKLLPVETILITSRATVGECVINTKPITTNQGFQNIICNDKYYNYLIFYLIKQFPNNLLRLSQGTTFLEISKNQIKKVTFPLSSSLPEQQKIATILSNVDNLIESTGKIIKNSKKVKKGLMQKLLTRGIGHVTFKKVPWYFGKEIEIPEEWEVTGIFNICKDIFLGLTTKVDYVDFEGIPLVRANNISKGKLSFKKIKYISKKQHSFLTRYHKAKQGDVLITKSGSLGICAIVDTNLEFSIYESIIVLQPNLTLLNSFFLLYLLRENQVQNKLTSDTVGSSVGHINLTDFRKLKIPLPPLPEQQKISSILSNVDSKIDSQVQYKEKLQLLKKSLMQKLLTGEVRV